MFKKWLCILLFFPITSVYASDSIFCDDADLAYLPATYAITLPDKAPDANQMDMTSNLRVFRCAGDLGRLDLQLSGISHWYRAGVAWEAPIVAGTRLFWRLSYNLLDEQDGGRYAARVDEQRLTGGAFHGGIRTQLDQHWYFSLQIGEIDTIINDHQIIGELGFKVNQQLSTQIRLRDYEQLNRSVLEFGLEVRF